MMTPKYFPLASPAEKSQDWILGCSALHNVGANLDVPMDMWRIEAIVLSLIQEGYVRVDMPHCYGGSES
jgi:hypothetical protein